MKYEVSHVNVYSEHKCCKTSLIVNCENMDDALLLCQELIAFVQRDFPLYVESIKQLQEEQQKFTEV